MVIEDGSRTTTEPCARSSVGCGSSTRDPWAGHVSARSHGDHARGARSRLSPSSTSSGLRNHRLSGSPRTGVQRRTARRSSTRTAGFTAAGFFRGRWLVTVPATARSISARRATAKGSCASSSAASGAMVSSSPTRTALSGCGCCRCTFEERTRGRRKQPAPRPRPRPKPAKLLQNLLARHRRCRRRAPPTQAELGRPTKRQDPSPRRNAFVAFREVSNERRIVSAYVPLRARA